MRNEKPQTEALVFSKTEPKTVFISRTWLNEEELMVWAPEEGEETYRDKHYQDRRCAESQDNLHRFNILSEEESSKFRTQSAKLEK